MNKRTLHQKRWKNEPSEKCWHCKHEGLSYIPRAHVVVHAWWHTLAIPALQRHKKVDPWGSLARESNLCGQFQVSEYQGSFCVCLQSARTQAHTTTPGLNFNEFWALNSRLHASKASTPLTDPFFPTSKNNFY